MKLQFNRGFHLFLDDEREPRQVTWVEMPPNVAWIIVRNYEEFTRTINHEARKGVLPGFIAFDHDLADEHYSGYMLVRSGIPYEEAFRNVTEKTGLDCAKWLVETHLLPNGLPPPEFVVHSMNPEGAANIRSYLESYAKSLQP